MNQKMTGTSGISIGSKHEKFIIAAMLRSCAINTTVRQAKTSDAEAISHLGGITFASAYGAIVRPEDMAGYVADIFTPWRISEEIEASDSVYLIAETESGIVGYAKLAMTETPEMVPADYPMELVRLYLDHRYYGRGIGEKLLSEICSRVVEAGHRGLWLRVWQKNEGAIRFYRRHGFEIVGSQPYFIGKTPNPVVLMCAELAAHDDSTE